MPGVPLESLRAVVVRDKEGESRGFESGGPTASLRAAARHGGRRRRSDGPGVGWRLTGRLTTLVVPCF